MYRCADLRASGEYEMTSAFENAASELRGLWICISLSDAWLHDFHRYYLSAVYLYAKFWGSTILKQTDKKGSAFSEPKINFFKFRRSILWNNSPSQKKNNPLFENVLWMGLPFIFVYIEGSGYLG